MSLIFLHNFQNSKFQAKLITEKIFVALGIPSAHWPIYAKTLFYEVSASVQFLLHLKL